MHSVQWWGADLASSQQRPQEREYRTNRGNRPISHNQKSENFEVTQTRS